MSKILLVASLFILNTSCESALSKSFTKNIKTYQANEKKQAAEMRECIERIQDRILKRLKNNKAEIVKEVCNQYKKPDNCQLTQVEVNLWLMNQLMVCSK